MSNARKVSLKEAAVPPGSRFYVIGDIHGRLDLLWDLLAAIEQDIMASPPSSVRYVFLGDYIDRGPDSFSVLETLIELTGARDTWFLRGNHEACALGVVRGDFPLDDWTRMGGAATLASYGVAPALLRPGCAGDEAQERFRAAMPLVHQTFLRSLRPYVICGDYCFVHAGIRPGRPIAEQAENDLLWIRNDFLLSRSLHEKVIVHGHSPVSHPEVKANRINIDTGAFATGILTCLRLERRAKAFITTKHPLARPAEIG